ncbi:tRNA ligase [Xylaria nigripes]|nr:tRNA ligase [Xylaria nigripes]
MNIPNTPFAEQNPQQISQVVQALSGGTSKENKGFRAKKTSFKIAGSPDGIVVDSWRLHDQEYKKPGLPTYARGLFTTTNSHGAHEIAVRGYDKFFNIGEVPDTKWNNIKTRTRGPYELSLKENGCIIFISGLEDGTLLICSKHATGDRSDVELSHAGAGGRWVDKQLATIGRTREEFARELRRRNVTAVAELCDDDFEEHILPYGPDKAGLYLHGVNLNVPQFMTYSGNLVQQFGDEWGFRRVGLQVFDDVDSIKNFLEGVAESGAHEGRDVEGFVIRCQKASDSERTEYNDWFFKYKFEEPYLLYRQWRECTKDLIAGRPPKIRKHVQITEEYLHYVRQRLAKDPNLGKLYVQNHGIISLRDDFLAFKNLKGSDAANLEQTFVQDSSSTSSDIVLVPIATIGCGKTTVGVALTQLFGWGIVQNDNIKGKNRPAQMVEAVMSLLKEHPVVIADRNNSERREREQIINDVLLRHTNARLVALNYKHNNIVEVRRVTRERVLKRGDNHQTIQAASDEKKFIGIMNNFIRRFQPCDRDSGPDERFDLIIDLDPLQESRVNVEKVVTELRKRYPMLIPNMPSAEDMDAAVKAAIEDYTPTMKHTIPDRTSKKEPKRQEIQKPQVQEKKKKPLEYMSISVPAQEINVALGSAFRGTDAETQRFYKHLQQTQRIQPLFHVTLMHRASAKERPALWKRYTTIHAESQTMDGKVGECEVVLERVVYDDRIMAIVVRLLDETDSWTCVNKVAHITVGTRDNFVKPKESNDLLARWLEVGSGSNTGIGERVFERKPILNGTVRGVLSR